MRERTASTRTRNVWREISRDPRAGIRELAQRTRHGTSQVEEALNNLEQLGYIRREHGRVGACAVLVFYAEVS